MEEPIDRGLPFELYDIWRKSILTPDFGDKKTVFDHVDFDLPDLEHGIGNSLFQLCDIEPLDASRDGDGLKRLASPDHIEDLQAPRRNDDVEPEEPFDPDIWDLRLEDRHNVPRLRTWEAFSNSNALPADGPTYISEAGPMAFHTLLSKRQSSGPARGALPQDVALKALASLAVGRSSVFFCWDETGRNFECILKDAPFLGLSSECTSSLVESFMQCGVAYRSLERFALDSLATSTALSALKRCVALVLESVDEYVTWSSVRVHSLLQLQTLVRMPTRLISMLQKLTTRLRMCSSDRNLLDAFSRSLPEMADGSSSLQNFLEMLFENVSAPWLERTLHSIGLAPSEATKSVSLQDTLPEMVSGMQDATKNEDEMPDFVDQESQRLIAETKHVLGTLREALPGHSLLSPIAYSGKGAWPTPVFPTYDTDALIARSTTYEADIIEGLQSLRYSDGQVSAVPAEDSQDNGNVEEQWPWYSPDQQESCLGNLATQIGEVPQRPIDKTEQDFKRVTLDTLEQLVELEEVQSLQLEDVHQPLSRLRPLLEEQWRLSNDKLLRHLFSTCKLRDHLQLQRDFHFLGSGEFVTRLSTALFSPDLQSAERKRGNLPKTTTMGLRLGASEGQRWPPASSELRLTLMGVLTQTSSALVGRSHSNGDRAELPGELSFAIRELPDAEIDRVVDAGSIYALDFLRLQYTAPPPLHTILTANAMQKYDDVFRYLLRLLRVLHVTTTLRHAAFTRRRADRPRGAASSFTVQAHHIATTLLSYGMEVGMEAPWRKLSSNFNDIELSLVLEECPRSVRPRAQIGLEGLKELHEEYLEVVRAALYLKRKQDQIRSAIERLLSTILRCASAIETTRALSLPDLAAFDAAVRQLLQLLQIVASKQQKPSSGAAARQGNNNESEQAKHLLDKLNWNRFYGDTDGFPAM